MQYTPDVFDAHEVLSWDSELASLLASSPPMPSLLYLHFRLPFHFPGCQLHRHQHARLRNVPRATHALATARLLRPRRHGQNDNDNNRNSNGNSNSSWITGSGAAAADGDGFIVVQIPLDIKSVPAAFYSNGRNIKEGLSPEKRKEVVIGIYTSIERGRRYGHHHHRRGGGGAAQAGDGDGDGDGDGHQSSAGAEAEGKGETEGETEWLMATASDARGVLPMWMQKMGTPGAVVKDVGLFMKWVQEKR